MLAEVECGALVEYLDWNLEAPELLGDFLDERPEGYDANGRALAFGREEARRQLVIEALAGRGGRRQEDIFPIHCRLDRFALERHELLQLERRPKSLQDLVGTQRAAKVVVGSAFVLAFGLGV